MANTKYLGQDGVTYLWSKIAAEDAKKANIASPSLTGTPTAPTAATTVSSTQIATTAFVHNVVTSAIDNAISASY